MMDVASDKPYLRSSARVLYRVRGGKGECNIPRKDILAVVVLEVDFSSTANRDTLGLAIHRLDHIGD